MMLAADAAPGSGARASATAGTSGGTGLPGLVRPARLLGVKELSEWFGFCPNTVTVWMRRYPDFPVPDVVVGKTPGWCSGRKAEILAWYVARGLRSGRLS